MIAPKTEADVSRVLARFKAIREAGKNLRGPLNTVGEIALSSIEENLLQGGRYESADSWRGGNTRWADLSESTKAARAKKGKWPGQKLQVSGILAASIQKNVTPDMVSVGSNMAYAGIQQWGGMAGPGRKVKIPARPYIVIQDEDVEDMMDVLQKYVAKQ